MLDVGSSRIQTQKQVRILSTNCINKLKERSILTKKLEENTKHAYLSDELIKNFKQLNWYISLMIRINKREIQY